MSLACSQCNATVGSQLRVVSSLISNTQEVPRSPNPSASSLKPISTFFPGLRISKKAVPIRLEKALPQARHESALQVFRARYVPWETTLLRPFLLYCLHLRLGQAISKVFRLGTTFLLCSFSDPLLLSEERITERGSIINIIFIL